MRRAHRGISLLEGVITLSVGAVLLLMVAPLFVRLISDHQVVALTNELVGHLQQARHAAIQLGTRVSLCSSSDGRRCTDSPWSRGYILFTDGGDAGQVDGRDRILKIVEARDSRLRVTLNGARYVQFLGSGGLATGLTRPVLATASPPSLLSRILGSLSPVATAHAAELPAPSPDAIEHPTFLVCNGAVGRAIRMSPVGRVTTAAVVCQ